MVFPSSPQSPLIHIPGIRSPGNHRFPSSCNNSLFPAPHSTLLNLPNPISLFISYSSQSPTHLFESSTNDTLLSITQIFIFTSPTVLRLPSTSACLPDPVAASFSFGFLCSGNSLAMRNSGLLNTATGAYCGRGWLTEGVAVDGTAASGAD